MNPIGIMQGRLSQPAGGRIQSFPVRTWREEFGRAREAGLDCIEWIYETGTDADNSLRSDAGIAEIRRLAHAFGVGVWSLCADYYMDERLVDRQGRPRREAVDHLGWLLGRASALGARYVVLPFVDASSLKTAPELDGLRTVLEHILPLAEKARVELHLETDLLPRDLSSLLETSDHPLIRANYDIGNAASLAHDPVEELTALGSRLGSVHVKDRVIGGGTVPLGMGAADFPTCFRLIRAAGFSGAFILQAARDPDIDEVELVIRNRPFVERHLGTVVHGAC